MVTLVVGAAIGAVSPARALEPALPARLRLDLPALTPPVLAPAAPALRVVALAPAVAGDPASAPALALSPIPEELRIGAPLPASPGPSDLRIPEPTVPAAAPAGPRFRRAVVEEALALGIGAAGYSVTRPETAKGARPQALANKLTFAQGSYGFDADSLNVNYVGHPVDGFVFYQLARSNRLSAWSSLGLTFAAAVSWEMLEYEEITSVHDIAATAAGGFALGEAFGALSSWLGQRDGLPSRLASMLFQLPAAVHDALDGVPRGPPVRFGVQEVGAWTLAGASTHGARPATSETRLGFSSRLVRSEDVGAPGRGWQAFFDGNVTSLHVEAALGEPGLVGVDFRALASLAALYGRDLDDDGNGWDLLVTASFGYDYLSREVPWTSTWRDDRFALMRMPGVELVSRVREGALRAEVALEAALTLGGVTPFALMGMPREQPGGPGVLRLDGYYHGLGGMLSPRLAIGLGGVELTAEWRIDTLSVIHADDTSPPPDGGRLLLQDERRALRAGIAWRPGLGALRVIGSWEERDRWGRAGVLTSSLRETSALLGVELRH